MSEQPAPVCRRCARVRSNVAAALRAAETGEQEARTMGYATMTALLVGRREAYQEVIEWLDQEAAA